MTEHAQKVGVAVGNETLDEKQKPRKARKTGELYSTDFNLTSTQRVAHFLDWAADHRPREFIPPNEILWNITGRPKSMPRLDNREVKLLKTCFSRAKKVLHEKYNRGYVSKPGVGVRATTDDFDRTKHALTKKAVQLGKAAAAFKAEHSAIDPSKIPQTAEAAPWRAWVQGAAKDLSKQLTDPAFERKLLPPVAPGAPEKK